MSNVSTEGRHERQLITLFLSLSIGFAEEEQSKQMAVIDKLQEELKRAGEEAARRADANENTEERLQALLGSNKLLKEERDESVRRVELLRNILRCEEGQEPQALSE